MFRRKLFKRVMPMLLSISMMFQTVSGTALAAEIADPDVAIEQTAAEETEVEETEVEETTAGDEETTAPETVDEEAEAAADEAEEAVNDEASDDEAAEVVNDETGESTGTGEGAETVQATATLTLDQSKIADQFETSYWGSFTYDYSYYKYDMVSDVILADYHKSEGENFTNDMKALLMEYSSALRVEGADSSELKYTWQKKNGDNFTNITDADGNPGMPSGVGSYRLAISLEATAGHTAAGPVYVLMDIRKTALNVRIYSVDFSSGTSVKDIKKANENVSLRIGDSYLDGGSRDENDAVVYNGKYIKSVSIKVRNSDENKELADTDLLKHGVNYAIVAEVTLKDEVKDSYEVTENAANIIVDGSIRTEVIPTPVTAPAEGEEFKIVKTYDGNPINVETEVANKYTVKVVKVEGEGESEEKTEITGAAAKVEGTWYTCDYDDYYKEYYNYKEIKDAPTDVGYYAYRLTYTDEDKIYGTSSADVAVQIVPADLVIKPKFTEENKTFYSDVTVKEVIKSVGYDVYKATIKVTEGTDGNTVTNVELASNPETIDAYYWGVYDINRSYEPIFVIQRGEKDEEGNISWDNYPLGQSDTLYKSDNVVYRLIFRGSKGVYYIDGTLSDTDSINSTMKNYKVAVTDEINSKYALDITLNAGTEAEIKVDELIEGGKGAELGKPIVKPYDGKALFDSKGAYKKATVSVKGGTTAVTEGELTYTWQYTYSPIEKDEEGKAYLEYGDNAWDDYKYNDIEVAVSPSSTGVYRLMITYKDESNQYYADPAYVYYTIKPQDIVLTLSGTPVAYTGGEEYDYRTTVGYFLDNIQNRIEELTASYVNVKAYPVEELTPNQDGSKATVSKKGETAIEDIDLEDILSTLYVEKKVTTDEGTRWAYCSEDERFVAETEYRLCTYWDYDYHNRYNAGKKLDDYGQVVDEIYDYYDNEPVSITLATGKEIAVSVDANVVKSQTKTYDGKPFELTTESVKSAITITDKATGTDITSQSKFYCYLIEVLGESDGYYDFGELYTIENVIHGGKYTLFVYVEDNGTYMADSFDGAEKFSFVIDKKEITITPKLKEDISAGIQVAYGYNIENYVMDGYDVSDGKDDISSVSWSVYKRDDKPYQGVLKSTEEYYLDCDVEFNDFYDLALDDEKDMGNHDRDYVVKSEKVVFTPKRAAGTLEKVNTGYSEDAKWDESVKRFIHTVNTTEAIPYNDSEDKNIFTVMLVAPMELSTEYGDFDFTPIENIFRDNNVGEITVEGYKSGYYEYVDGNTTEYDRPYVQIKLDATNMDKKDFTIFWGPDYTEQYVFDFSGSLLQANFAKAVEPKSIAFNKPNAKMVVGDEQQLDVKLTKVQMNDIIYLGYKSDNEDVLYVTESGYVTALATGTASIEVYPCVAVRNSEGNYVKTRIEGAKVKSATVKITVSEVAAPKINGVTQVGNDGLKVKYQKPANGYRREIYLLSGKKTIKDFEDAIDSVNKGNYSELFDYMGYSEPTGTSYYENANDQKKGIVTVGRLVGELTPSTEYTVYIRNVSRIRTVDGRKVTLSHAGAVKTFKVTKPQLKDLWLYFDPDTKGQTVKDYDGYYYAELKDKSAKLSVKAKFDAKYFDTNADKGDYVWRPLPLAGDDKKNFEAPKLDYFISEYDYETDEEILVKSNDIASVDKNGKITFKGRGWVEIKVIDTKSGGYDYIGLYINASPNSMTGKKVKVLPGDGFYLSSCLEYKQDKIKLSGYQSYADLRTDAVSNDSFKIQKVYNSYEDQDGVFEIYDYYITALKPGATLDIQVTDTTVTANGGAAATVQVTSSAVEPVKKLKAERVYDREFTVTFNYPMSSYNFKYELTDSRDDVILSKIANLSAKRWDPKAKSYEYRLRFSANNFYENDGSDIVKSIEMLSNYNFTITALCNDAASKDTKLKIKTTNIPASYYDVNDRYYKNYGRDWYELKNGLYYGYSDIVVHNGKGTSDLNSAILVSGNSYTLELPLEGSKDNKAARLRKTDTLTWSIKVDKDNGDTAGVATIKANAGSYTATFKAMQPGYTTIEVSSKLTKKVIARYRVYVSAVSDAHNGRYFGDNEPH